MARWCRSVVLGMILVAGVAAHADAAGDIVLYSADFGTLRGNWSIVSSSDAAGGQRLTSNDYGWSSTASAQSSPADYVEATFSAPASTAYHVWLRLRATNNSKYNDSVYVQFSDATDVYGGAVHRIGTPSALTVNGEPCNECGVGGWGWSDGAYWLSQASTVKFTGSGSHTIRIQTREDGVQIDQVVLSPATYLTRSPGGNANDSTILPRSSGTTSTSTATLIQLPGQIDAQTFDNGGEGVAYHDSTPGNAGGVARSTDVDIENSSEGGYDIGWTTAGEWINYTVNAAAGSYSVQLRVASASGGTVHVGFNGPSNVWKAVSVPPTGGWQQWTTLTVPVTLGGGQQKMTLLFDTGGVNFRYANVVSGSTSGSTSTGSSSSTSTAAGAYVSMTIPGKVEAENYDKGASGVSYYDSTPGNSGGQYRSGDVDIEASSDGGYDIGWTAAGEWMNYTVNVGSAGSYTAQVRVASPSGGQLHVGFNGPSSVWKAVNVPATGSWQSWTTVNVPVTLGAGSQQMTLMFDTAGVNVNYINVVAGSTSTSTTQSVSSGTSTSATGLSVATWNIEINGTETHARLAIDGLMAIGPRPQIITIQEANLAMFNVYLDELNRQTGQTWHGVFATHCEAGKWNGSSCSATWYQGVGIFTPYTIVDSSSTLFPYADCWTSARAGLRAAVSVGGTTVQVFTTHLQTGGCTNDAQSRYSSMSRLKSWASGYSSPQIVAGDFNADPDQIDTTSGMLPNFVDTWSVVGSGRGFSAFGPSPNMKIDYWFTDSSNRAQPISSQVIYGTGSASDHYPVQTTFSIH